SEEHTSELQSRENLVCRLLLEKKKEFNDTRVIPARLFGQKETGGRVEILIERLLPANRARAQLGVDKPPRPGSRIELDAGGEAVVLDRGGGFYHLQFEVPGALEAWLLEAGRLPLPPYIRRVPGRDDAVFFKDTATTEIYTLSLHDALPI